MNIKTKLIFSIVQFIMISGFDSALYCMDNPLALAPIAIATAAVPVVMACCKFRHRSEKTFDAWDEQTVKKQELEVLFNLGSRYTTGDGVQEDIAQAALFFEQASKHGRATPDSLRIIGQHYYEKTKYSDAFKWFKKAGDQENAIAQCYLGILYENGMGIEKNSEKGISWYRKSAEQECIEAQINLADYYAFDCGINQDFPQAAQWYQKAAAQGYGRAKAMMGLCFMEGLGTKINYDQAFNNFQSAENDDPIAQIGLGLCYERGYGTEVDQAKGQELCQSGGEKLMALQNENINPTEQCTIGLCYHYGNGTEQDLGKAVEWYQKAADKNYSIAQFNLGACYHHGTGVEKDFNKARDLYKQAAQKGLAIAQYYMGITGFIKDKQEAIAWYQKAASQGHTVAQERLQTIESTENKDCIIL